MAAAALLLGGCSANSNTDLVAGKQLFVKDCGSCHTLAHAGTKGTAGPNLDQAFAASVREDFGESAIAGVVRGQIKAPGTYPAGHVGTAMPAKLATGADAENIAAYVASVVAQPGRDEGLLANAVPKTGSAPPAVEKNGVLTFTADPNGQLAYTTNKATASAGDVTIVMENASGVIHNVAIQEGTSGANLAATKEVPKGTEKATATLKAGTNYTFYCEVNGHRQAGMLGTLTVK